MEYDDDPQPAGPHSDVWETSEEPAPGFRHPWFVEENREPLEMLFDAEGFPVILFDPVPLLRRRKKGWDENRQRAFISMLAQRVPVRTAPSHPKCPLPSPTRAASRP